MNVACLYKIKTGHAQNFGSRDFTPYCHFRCTAYARFDIESLIYSANACTFAMARVGYMSAQLKAGFHLDISISISIKISQ